MVYERFQFSLGKLLVVISILGLGTGVLVLQIENAKLRDETASLKAQLANESEYARIGKDLLRERITTQMAEKKKFINLGAFSSKANEPAIEWTLSSVIDGNTIEVEYEGELEQVRLLRIDTPERGEPGFNKATDALKKILVGYDVVLDFEKPGKEARDRYERLLCYVFVDTGKGWIHVNVEMVMQGHSRFWTKYGEGRYAEEFRAAEKEAMQQAMNRGVRFDGIKPHPQTIIPSGRYGPANGVVTPEEPQQKEKE